MKKRITQLFCVILTMLMLIGSFVACSDNSESFTEITEDEDVEYATFDEKYQIFNPLSAQLAGDLDFNYTGKLGYGYNLLTAAYYNDADIRKDAPVLDLTELSTAGKVYVDRDCANASANYFLSSSTREYSEKISASASVEGKIGLTGSFEANFAMDHSASINSNQMLITAQSRLVKRNEYIFIRSDKDLGSYLSENFEYDLEDDFSAAGIVNKYGTHVLKNIYMGGRFDMNYVYTNVGSTSYDHIEASAAASTAFVSGDASVETTTAMREVTTNSSMRIKSYGGSVNVNATSVEAAKNSYTRWAESIDNDNTAIIDCSAVIPLWTLVANSGVDDATDKANAIKEYFMNNSSNISAEFRNSASIELYLSVIKVGRGARKDIALDELYTQNVFNSQILMLDMNYDIGGYFVFVAYIFSSDPTNAIRGLVARHSTKSGGALVKINDIKYEPVPYDLKRGIANNWIYLYYTRDSKAGKPITDITYQLDGKYENDVEPKNYERIQQYGLILQKQWNSI